MRCVSCGWPLPLEAKGLGLTRCTVCGNEMLYDVTDVFEDGAEGIVKEKRPGQIAMAQLIDENLYTDEQTVMLLEGGTGIGKSYAYLIPPLLKHREAILHDKLHRGSGYEQHELYTRFLKGKIYVSTTTIQLQDHICEVDLKSAIIPKLGLNPDIRAVSLKGARNYACLHPAVAENLETAAQKKEYENLIHPYRAERTCLDEKYVKGLKPSWWDSITLENCLYEDDKRPCPFSDVCKPDISGYNVIIVNHHMMGILMAHNLLKETNRFGSLAMLVVDEAHSFISSLYTACTQEVKESSLSYLGKKISKDPYTSSMKVVKNVDAMVSSFSTLLAECRSWKTATNSPGGIMLPKANHTAQERVITHKLFPDFMACLLTVYKYVTDRAEDIKPLEEPKDVQPKKGVTVDTGVNHELLAAYSRFVKYGNKLIDVKDALDAAMATFETGVVEKKLPVINENSISVVPADIGEYAHQFLDGVSKSLFLSATLSIGGDFTYMKKQLGLNLPPISPQRPTTVVERIFDSPFDYTSNGFSYTPLHVVPCPKYGCSQEDKDTWYDSMADEITILTEKNEGDAFVLFTSRVDMENIYQRCFRNKPANSTVSYIIQDAQGPAAEAKYRATNHAVLFGLKSFQEGVDVPGDKLRMVIIVKLPFPIMSDPVLTIEGLKAEAAGLSAFEEVQIPRMLFALKQAAGRLIRTLDDKGVVVILDSRIWTGRESWKLRKMQAAQAAGLVVTPLGYGAAAMKMLNFKYRVDNRQMFPKMLNRLYANNPVK